MKSIFKFHLIIACQLLFAINLIAQDIPDYFKGIKIAEGKKAEWLPDGKTISYVNDDVLYSYDISKKKSRKLLSMKVAQYRWLNNDSALVIEWPDNVTEKKKIKKIVNYWIVQRSGKKSMFAADTSMTRKIPHYNKPVRLPDGTIALRKNPGWPQYGLPQTEKYIAFNAADYDLGKNIKDFRFATATQYEGGSIHFKNINKVNEKTIVIGKHYYRPILSPDYSRIIAYTNTGLDVLDSNGVRLFDQMNFLDKPEADNLDKFFGAVWNNRSDGFVCYELYDSPKDFVNISYYNLNKKVRTILTRSFYYGNSAFRFSPDNMSIVAMMDYNNKSYITLIDIPESGLSEDK